MDTQQPQSGSRKRKRRGKVDAQDLSREEQARRQKQRELRELALKLKASGKVYKPKKRVKAKAVSGAGAPAGATGLAKAHRGVQNTRPGSRPQDVGFEGKEETGTRPDKPPQVIVVPIFWNKKADEKKAVIDAAEEVAQQLQAAGVEAALDTTNVLAPGQKYKYWEDQGVKVRVELGPRDAQARKACLALCKKPGEVADKSFLQVGAPLTSAVQQALGQQPLNKISFDSQDVAPQAAGGDDAPAQEQPAAAGKKAKPAISEPEGKQSKQQVLTPHQPAATKGGDDLDDFQLDTPEENPKQSRKKPKKHCAIGPSAPVPDKQTRMRKQPKLASF